MYLLFLRKRKRKELTFTEKNKQKERKYIKERKKRKKEFFLIRQPKEKERSQRARVCTEPATVCRFSDKRKAVDRFFIPTLVLFSKQRWKARV